MAVSGCIPRAGPSACGSAENEEQVPGVDALFIGPSDLAASMGHIGNPGHPEVCSGAHEPSPGSSWIFEVAVGHPKSQKSKKNSTFHLIIWSSANMLSHFSFLLEPRTGPRMLPCKYLSRFAPQSSSQ